MSYAAAFWLSFLYTELRLILEILVFRYGNAVGCAMRTEINMQVVDSWCAWRTLVCPAWAKTCCQRGGNRK
jgi:hypothetical protein